VARVRGMTLIELLIVFSIVGLLVSLVAPASFGVVDKARAQEEWLILDRLVGTLSFRAYSESREITLEAKEQTLKWFYDGEQQGVFSLSYLRFTQPQRLVISASGLSDQEQLSVAQAERNRPIKLNRWLGKS
jgi:prepilin-type N-terminal cleavage/methylation domain-containing protein